MATAELERRQEELEAAHAEVMDRLYRALAADNGSDRWEHLSCDQRAEIISVAHEICEEWANLPIARAVPTASLSPVMRLVAAQHRIVELIMWAEDRKISAIGRATLITASMTLH